MTALSLVSAIIGGILAHRLRVPTGRIVGAVVGAGVFSVAVRTVSPPDMLRTALVVGVGVMVGSLVTRNVVRQLRHALVPAATSAVLLIAAGIGIALGLRAAGIAPAGDMLATSPGAMSVLSAAAAEHGTGAPTVAMFHVVRVVLILLTLPLVLRFLPSPRREPPGAEPLSADRPPSPDDDVPAAHHPVGEDTSDPPDGENQTDPGRPSRRTRPAGPIQLGLATIGSTAGVLAALALGIDGALILGATSGAAVVTLAHRSPGQLPSPVRAVVQIGLGWLIGTHISGEVMTDLGRAAVPAVLAAALLILAGLATTSVLRRLDYSLPGDVLATSPGAVEVLATTAVEYDAGPAQVALFHTVRIILVIVSLPMLLRLLP